MTEKRLQAGFGVGTIRFPETLFPLEGFRGVHDDPKVRLMVLKNGVDGLALLALELVLCPPDMIEAWRVRIGALFGLPKERVWCHVNHTITTPHEPGHRGPFGPGRPLTSEEERKRTIYRSAVNVAVNEAMTAAKADLSPARLGWGEGQCVINGNRDVETPFGWWIGKAGGGPTDHTLTVLRVDGASGTHKGAVMFYGLKPCAIDNSGMRDGVRLVSAEVTGMACAEAERMLRTPVLFCMTAAADQAPVKQSLLDIITPEGLADQADEGPEKGLRYACEMGHELALAAAQAVRDVRCVHDDPAMAWGHTSFSWPRCAGSGPRQLGKKPVYTPEGTETVTAELFRLGDTALVAVKPEINCVTGMELAQASPFSRTILITMVNGDMHYLPDQSAYDRFTPEAQSAILMPGAAERLVEQTARALTTMITRRK